MPALRKVSPQLFTKTVITKGYGFHTPQDGSVCKIKVVSDERSIITDLDESKEKEIIVGDVDEPIDRIIEDCIRTMKEEEVCCLRFDHPDDYDYAILADAVLEVKNPTTPAHSDDSNQESQRKEPEVVTEESNVNETKTEAKCSGGASEVAETKSEVEPGDGTSEDTQECVEIAKSSSRNMVEAKFQLLAYTREPEIWEMSVTEKWRRASYHKQRGLELYSRGAYQYAFRRFGLTLKYVISLEHDVPSGQEEGMDIKGLKLSCYLNVAACQMRHHNYESVVINSTKALELQPNNAKALYRRGSAHLQLQEYEKAKEDLTTAQQLEPKNQAVAKQLQLLKNQVQKLNQYYASAMKKLFT